MSTAVCAASRHPDIENVSPGTENVGGTTKGKKFFKSHARRKATNQQDQQETSGKDGQENRRLRRRLIRKTSNVAQISLRVAPFLRNLRSNRNQTNLDDQPAHHSVRFDLARNQNHCYEDENYMHANRPASWLACGVLANEYDQYMSGGCYDRDLDTDDYYSSLADEPEQPGVTRKKRRTDRREMEQPETEQRSVSAVNTGASDNYTLYDAEKDIARGGSAPKAVLSPVTDEYSDDCAAPTGSTVNTSGQLNRVCDCSTSVKDSDRQPLAVIDMARPAASDPSLDSEAVADGAGMSCMAAPAPVFASPRPAETFKRASTYDELDPLQEANAAKRRYIGISPEQQPEVRLRMEHLAAEVHKEEDIERQASHALELCQSRSSKLSEEEIAIERLLLLSGTKAGRCQSELKQLQKSDTEGGFPSRGSSSSVMFNPLGMRPCVATIHLSDICLPLHLGYLASFSRDAAGYFVVVCRCGPDVVSATKVKCTRDAPSLSSGIVFDETLTLERIHCDADIELEVYYFTSGKSRDHDSSSTPLTSTPTKKLLGGEGSLTLPSAKKGILGFKSEFMGSPLRSPAVVRSLAKTSRFQLAASSTLSLSALRKHTQLKLQEWSSNHVVFGHVFATVTGRAHYDEHAHSGFLTWREEVDGIPNWRRLWCEQTGTLIKAWQYPSDKETKEPVKLLDLTVYTEEQYSLRVDVADQDVSVRKYSLMLTAMPPHKIGKTVKGESDIQMHVFSADSRQECSSWIEALQRVVDDLEAWRSIPHEADT